MRFTKESLNAEKGITKEWIITNGLGGYSASTIIGTNTRKYHGLLIAPLLPPAKRFLILSKLDESIEMNNKKYDLFTNMGKEYLTKGYEYQTEFEKNFLPIFKYKVEDTKITKVICMEYGKNTVIVYYKIKNGTQQAKLILTPIINYRDFHSLHTNDNFELQQGNKNNKVKMIVDHNETTPIYMNLTEGKYVKNENNVFRNMFYIEEEKRGFDAEENHIVPGSYEVNIKPNEEKDIGFVCSLEENIEELNIKRIIDNEIIRIGEIFNKSLLIDNRSKNKTEGEKNRENLIREYLIATDNFIAYRPNFGLHTMLAGYPWFLDWGRDTLLSFEGIFLIPRRFEMAKEVLKTMIRDIKYGLVPNGYSEYDNAPLYNSVDASLLLFEQAQKYIKYTNDYRFVSDILYPKMEEIIENYAKGINIDNNNIYLDGDYLLVSGTTETQNTWMDAKYNGVAITPRNGKAVEINSLWYNANKIMEQLSQKFGFGLKAKKYKKFAENCKIAFRNKFYCEETKCLYDVLGDSKIRPNQLFAFSLTYPIMDFNSRETKNSIKIIEEKLLNDYGVKTLAEGEEKYVARYEGNAEKRDKSYHQGITWPWLLGIYYDTLKNQYINTKEKNEKKEIEIKIKNLIEKTTKTFREEMEQKGCIGSIAELYDSEKPQLPKGTFAQAWSVAETFRIILGK